MFRWVSLGGFNFGQSSVNVLIYPYTVLLFRPLDLAPGFRASSITTVNRQIVDIQSSILCHDIKIPSCPFREPLKIDRYFYKVITVVPHCFLVPIHRHPRARNGRGGRGAPLLIFDKSNTPKLVTRSITFVGVQEGVGC